MITIIKYVFTLPNLVMILLSADSWPFTSQIFRTSTSMSELLKFVFSKNKWISILNLCKSMRIINNRNYNNRNIII